MIHVKMFNMFNEDERRTYESLLNQNYLEKTIRVVDLKHHSDREGTLFIYMVYADVETRKHNIVEYNNVEFPTAFHDEAMFQMGASPDPGPPEQQASDPTAPMPATFVFQPQKKDQP
jgi:hypothetical protein